MVEFAELTVVTEKPAPGPALGPQIKKNKTKQTKNMKIFIIHIASTAFHF